MQAVATIGKYDARPILRFQGVPIMRIALLPPDERPNTRGYAVTIGNCAGVEVLTPPPEAMPYFRTPADTDALADWLRRVAADVDHVIVPLELLVYGGFVPSRNTDDRMTDVLPRPQVLRDIDVPISAFGVVTRLPTYDNPGRSRQEPEYWISHGERLGTLSRLWDEHALGEVDAEAVAAARAEVPEEFSTDMVLRRSRNHAVNLAALEMAADGVFETLVITSDDTAARGLPAVERRLLSQWVDRLGVDVLMYPGADEVPSVLVGRVAMQAAGVRPRVAIACPEADGLNRVAPYEDRPLRVGLAHQIRTIGADLVDDAAEADVVLAVHPPSPTPGDWVSGPPEPEAAPEALLTEVERHLDAGRRVALADVRYANGSHPELAAALDRRGLLSRLTSYGGWNTAGNTIGTTIAAACSALAADDESARAARQRFLARKIIEDAHYLPVVRRRIQDEAMARGVYDPPINELLGIHHRITDELQAWMRDVDALQGWSVRNARLPWTTTFTVDFELSGQPEHDS